MMPRCIARNSPRIFAENSVRSIKVAYMEVPCCFGLAHLVRQALDESGKVLLLTVTKISIKGEILETHQLQAGQAGRRPGSQLYQ